MISFANRYRMPTSIRQNRPLTNDELARISLVHSLKRSMNHVQIVIHTYRQLIFSTD